MITYGTTKKGTPCKRCIKKGVLCKQHAVGSCLFLITTACIVAAVLCLFNIYDLRGAIKTTGGALNQALHTMMKALDIGLSTMATGIMTICGICISFILRVMLFFLLELPSMSI
jgi:hypothetical protein